MLNNHKKGYYWTVYVAKGILSFNKFIIQWKENYYGRMTQNTQLTHGLRINKDLAYGSEQTSVTIFIMIIISWSNISINKVRTSVGKCRSVIGSFRRLRAIVCSGATNLSWDHFSVGFQSRESRLSSPASSISSHIYSSCAYLRSPIISETL